MPDTHFQNGGLGVPWGPQPPTAPTGGGASGVRFCPISFIPGQLPGEGAGPGDTQVGYPTAPAAPVTVPATFAAGTPLVIRYMEAGATPISANDAFNAPPIKIYLGAGAAGPTVPGSVRFTFRGRTYVDRAGGLYYGISTTTNAGTLGGSYDYSLNTATVTDYGTGSNTVTIVSLATRYVDVGADGVMFRTPGAPLRAGSFTLRATTMDGTELTAAADINGDIVDTNVKGHVDWRTGLTRVAFGALVTAAGNESEQWYNADLIDGMGKIWKPVQVDPSSVFFGTVVYRSIPVDAELVGIDPVRLPSDGRVLGFNPGTPGVVSHTQVTSLTPASADVTDLGRERISFIEVVDSASPPVPIADVWYTLDLDAGTVTWANTLNLSTYTMPVKIRDRIQDIALISDVQITGQVSLASPITHDYPSGAVLSNALPFIDMQSRYTNLFDQATYVAGVWSDTLSGAAAGGTYNDTIYPIALENDSAIDDRWAVVFTAPTVVNVIGEKSGQVLTAVSITSDIAPINPVSGVPYFTIDHLGFGGGWSGSNVIRFNTVSATRPIWAARVTLPAVITVDNDAVRIQAYGNAH